MLWSYFALNFFVENKFVHFSTLLTSPTFNGLNFNNSKSGKISANGFKFILDREKII